MKKNRIKIISAVSTLMMLFTMFSVSVSATQETKKKVQFPLEFTVESVNSLPNRQLVQRSVSVQLRNEYKTFSEYAFWVIEEGQKEPVFANSVDKNDVIEIELRKDAKYIVQVNLSQEEEIREFGGDLTVTAQGEVVLNFRELVNEKNFGGGSKALPTYAESEPNNSMTQANQIYPEVSVGGKISYSTDSDYFKLTMGQTTGIDLILDIPASTDYDLCVFEGTSKLIVIGNKRGGLSEHIQFAAKPNTTYYIKIYGYSGSYSASSFYQLKVTKTSPYPLMKWSYMFRDNPIPTDISSSFGWRTSPTTGKSQFHEGFDIPANRYTNLYCATSGEVVKKGYEKSKDWGRGYYIVIETNNVDPETGIKLSISYYHMEEASSLNEGDYVNEYDLVGRVGSSGASTGCHLHFGVINNGAYVATEDNCVEPSQFFPNITFTGDLNITLER